eukprot:scaffold162343_cov19-Prasinocladus_malaysianus.AAC.1
MLSCCTSAIGRKEMFAEAAAVLERGALLAPTKLDDLRRLEQDVGEAAREGQPPKQPSLSSMLAGRQAAWH